VMYVGKISILVPGGPKGLCVGGGITTCSGWRILATAETGSLKR
jgi:hypothetical protein